MAKLNKVQLEKEITNIAAERINKLLPKLQEDVEKEVDELILRGLNQSSTFQSLTANGPGELRQELGLTDSEEKSAELIAATQESVTISIKPLRGGVRARRPILRLKVEEGNLRNIANQDFAFQANSPRFSPELLPWLRWLLTGGRSALVRNSRILQRPGRGRNAGGSIMSRNDPRGSWAVPPEHSGTITNNFITRMFDAISNDVRAAILKRLNRIRRT